MGERDVALGSGVPEGVVLKSIPGVDSAKYMAGSDGHIYSYSRARTNARRPCPFRLSAFVGEGKYPHVSIIDNGKQRNKSVHVLICLSFHGPKPTSTHEVRHLDGNKKNSSPDNLAWGTPAENEADKRRHGTAAIGSKQGIAKLNEEAVRILRIAIPRGLWNARDAAQVFGVDASTINRVARGDDWKHVE